MTDDLVKRLRTWTGDGWIGDDYAISDQAADRIEELEQQIAGLDSVVQELIDEDKNERIEELERQLSLINNSLEVTLTEEITKNWVEFCEALIAETREVLGENKQ